MCGIAAVLNLNTPDQPIDKALITRMRDRLTHRGPDDAGLWQGQWGTIGHRRLTVIDPTPAGHQPFVSPDQRYILAYNGELYNDHDLRAELASMGVVFRTNCDTETLLHALITWGDQAIDKLRGMYAFVFLDTQTQHATIARDPMGIKPIYHASIEHNGNIQLAIASEITALLEHPAIARDPDPVTFSAYLSSIRTTLGHRTMYRQIQTLEPGDWISLNLKDPADAIGLNWWQSAPPEPTQGLRQTIEDSLHRHLRTDVPMCALLSGGLDSAITTWLAMQSLGSLNTYCAGAKNPRFDDDFTFARQMARHIGSKHHEIEVTQDDFTTRWPEMVNQLANPMSTPNEVAIFAVASALRAQGHIVTISGEGADELFGGYGPIMQQCAAHIDTLADPFDDPNAGLFHLQSNAWISHELKPNVLNPVRLAEADNDQHLHDHYNTTFNQLRAGTPQDSPLQTHLRFQRRMNLPNLLQRLDTATMLAGVEGRTPFADIEVAICAEALPMDRKYQHDPQNPRTKIALREAFAKELPPEIVNRPKASFPLPFQHWLAPFSQVLTNSPFAHKFFTPQAMALVSSDPNAYWHMAWPMINLTLWGHAWVLGEPIDPQQLAYDAACS
jgi:asparagine synthase (glutamine-hydrolysing)